MLLPLVPTGCAVDVCDVTGLGERAMFEAGCTRSGERSARTAGCLRDIAGCGGPYDCSHQAKIIPAQNATNVIAPGILRSRCLRLIGTAPECLAGPAPP